jgi:hypothetical protein
MNVFAIIWLLLGVAGGTVEVLGLTMKKATTLSHLVWKLKWPGRAALAAGLVALAVHFLVGG